MVERRRGGGTRPGRGEARPSNGDVLRDLLRSRQGRKDEPQGPAEPVTTGRAYARGQRRALPRKAPDPDPGGAFPSAGATGAPPRLPGLVSAIHSEAPCEAVG